MENSWRISTADTNKMRTLKPFLFKALRGLAAVHSTSGLVVALTVTVVVFFPVSIDGSSRLLLAAQNDSTAFDFRWAFIGALDRGGRKDMVAIQHDTALASGDRFKLYIQPVTECYIYVFWSDSKSDLHTMFPSSQDQFAKDWTPGTEYFIPGGDEWYQLDKYEGKESLYLLASRGRQRTLEELIEQMRSTAGKEKELAKVRLLNEIRSLRRQYQQYVSLAEKPVTIAGNVRGPGTAGGQRPSVETMTNSALEVSAKVFFSKTIIIDHR